VPFKGALIVRSLELADENLVIATLQGKLPKLGADATEDALATECVGYVLLKLLVFGMGGSDWTISGDALLVDQRDGAKGDSQGDKRKEPPSKLWRDIPWRAFMKSSLSKMR
jgi:hypothetical protein